MSPPVGAPPPPNADDLTVPVIPKAPSPATSPRADLPPPPPPPPLPDPNSPEGRVALAPGVEILPEDRVPDLPRPPTPGGDGPVAPPGPA
ncbi:MAG: OmpA family protein, partial [Planctomycetia bacterium]|nr:OmpA family protein [Planctomycetia bacterium]